MQTAAQQTAMPSETETISQPFIASLAALVATVGQLAGNIADARRKAKAVSDLRQLDDRMLADIGLSRSQISAAVYGELNNIR